MSTRAISAAAAGPVGGYPSEPLLTRYTAALMNITSRSKAIAFFIVLGSTLVAFALALNVTWIMHWRGIWPLVIGIVLFALIIAGLIINTVFLVREIRRNEQHDSFINAVTHELKTPIASIRLYLETLQSRPLSAEQRQSFYRIMHQDTDRLTDTVEQVLRAAETVQQNGVRNWAPVNLQSLLHECIELARQRHQLSNDELIEVNADTTFSHASVKGDAEQLRTAIGNLLDNAAKYSQPPVHIEAALHEQNDALLLTVKDQGAGIPRSDLKQIFKRFYRTGRSRTKVKGTGLGLFIVRAIMKRHHGSAIAESAGEGHGATFTLRFPKPKS
jgi:two-component system, OmpR family, sensor histidine kinase SenX3